MSDFLNVLLGFWASDFNFYIVPVLVGSSLFSFILNFVRSFL